MAVRAPLYVPKPEGDAPWVGRAGSVALVLLAALASTPSFTTKGTRQFNYVPEPGWRGEPSVTSSVLFQLPALPPFTAKPTKQFNHVPEPYWVEGGGAVPLVQTQLPALPPFTAKGTRRFDYVPEPVWTGDATPVPLRITLPPSAALPFSNPRRFYRADEIPALKSIPFLLAVPVQAVLPSQNTRRFEHVPEPGWRGEPSVTSSVLFQLPAQPPVTVKPTRQFNVVPEPYWVGEPTPVALVFTLPQPVFTIKGTRQFNYVPEPGWLGEPSVTSNVLFQLPALPSFTVKGTRKFDHVPEPGWLGEPVPVSLLYTLPPPTVLPFANRPWQGPPPSPDWVKGGGSVPLVQTQLPALPPFTVRGTAQFNHFVDAFWLGEPKASPLVAILPPLSLPFSNAHFNNYVPDPQPRQASFPTPQVLLQIPAVPPFTVKGTRQFHVPDFVPWSMYGKGSKTIYLPVAPPVQLLKNVIVRARILSGDDPRVRTLVNTGIRIRTIKNTFNRSDE